MINLEELQEQIDNLLETETSSSLTSWILNKRFKDLNHIIGEGQFVSLNLETCNSFEFIQELDSDIEVVESPYGINTSFSHAA